VNTWLPLAACLAGFLLLFALVQALARTGVVRAEGTRKMMHGGSGLLTLTFPFIFGELWPVLFLTSAAALLMGLVKFVPPLRRRMGGAVSGVNRTTVGELYFPIAVAVLFWLAAAHGRADPSLLFPTWSCLPRTWRCSGSRGWLLRIPAGTCRACSGARWL